MCSKRPSSATPERRRRRALPVGPRRAARALAFAALVTSLLSACGSTPTVSLAGAQLAPLQLDGEIYTVSDALQSVPSPDLLAMDASMREFVATHTAHSSNPRNRLLALHSAIKSPAILDMQYDPFADGDARIAFHRGSANCLSYAHLFVALAREARLDARYQWMEIRPEWHRLGERVALRLHVNVVVKIRGEEEYIVDIDPLRRHEVVGARRLSDRDALALYHSNIAMQALGEGRVGDAWMQLVRGIDVAPRLAHLWTNLGAVYRHAGQYEDAEEAYFTALALDDNDRSAMNNLVVLYDLTGREEEYAYWLDRLARYRERNPYYHAGLGDSAVDAKDWDAAYRHYARAMRLQPEDSRLVYSLGLVEHRRGNLKEATRLIRKAIETAAFDKDIRDYRMQLRVIEAQRAAAL
jgi:Flp pilus assembly protein TadD